MPTRIDALGETSRHHLFRGRLLEEGLDDELQAIVELAATEVGVPIALVSLVLDRVQYFRAHRGLPSDLALTQATDRDISFCQLVVRAREPIEIVEALDDARVPQALVQSHGVRAYLGMPLDLGEGVIGTLCVLDDKPRDFSSTETALLHELARRVVHRLQALAGERRERALTRVPAAIQPAIGELRSALSPLGMLGDEISYRITELRPLAKAAGAGAAYVLHIGSLAARAEQALAGLHSAVQSLQDSVSRSTGAVNAIVGLLEAAGKPAVFAEVVRIAAQLAEPATALAGEVRWDSVPPSAHLAVPGDGAAAIIAAAMIGVTQQADTTQAGDLRITCRLDDGFAVLELRRTGLTAHNAAAVAEQIRPSAEDIGGGCYAIDAAVSLFLPTSQQEDG